MDLLVSKNQIVDPISKEYILYENLFIMPNVNNTTFLFFDIFTLIDCIIFSNSLINPIYNVDFSKKNLKSIINVLYNKKIIDFNQKITLYKKLKNKYFKEIFIFNLSKCISKLKKKIYINDKINKFIIKNNDLHNNLSKELNNIKEEKTDNVHSILIKLYNELNK